MNLDCIKTDDGKWVVIDTGNDNKKITRGSEYIATAWHEAALKLQYMINDAKSKLDT